MSYQAPKYEIELWHRGTTRLGEIGKYCRNISYKVVRNGVDSLDFDIDLAEFEAFCERIGEEPRNVLEPLITDIKVKRNGQYLFGTFVQSVEATFGEQDSTIAVSADGYLNLLADRYVSANYGQIEATEIAWDLIYRTEDQLRGDLGISKGQMFTTGKLRDRNYEDQNVKEGVVNLTQLVDGNFDFRFTAFREFETFESLGNPRPDVVIQYPALSNGTGAKGLSIPRSAANLYNRIIGKGSGFGEETLTHIANDEYSQTTWFLKEKITTYNDISVLGTLVDHVEGELSLTRDMLELPKLDIDGSQLDIGDVWVGDQIVVQQTKYSMFAMDGYFRIEAIDVKLDDNMAEDISLTLDNFGL